MKSMSVPLNDVREYFISSLDRGNVDRIEASFKQAEELAHTFDGFQVAWQKTRAGFEIEKTNLETLQQRVTNVNAQRKTVEETIHRLQSEHDAQRKTVEETIHRLHSKHDALQGHVDDLRGARARLQEQLKADQSRIATLESDKVTISKQKAKIKHRFEDCEEKERDLGLRERKCAESERALESRRRAVEQGEQDSRDLQEYLANQIKERE